MNSITPFCAVRANPEIAAKFSSESFEFYTDNSLKKILDHNPHSFLQLIKPNIIPNKGMTSTYLSSRRPAAQGRRALCGGEGGMKEPVVGSR